MTSHGRSALQQQGALADSRITAHQHQGSGHESATEDPIEFTRSGLQALERLIIQGRHRRGAAGRRRLRRIGRDATAAAIRGRLGLLNQRIPAAAFRTATKELSGFRSTALTNKDGGGFGHCEL